MTKYASCSRAHCSQKGTPRISTTARREQGRSVLLPTWHSPSSFVASVFSKSSTATDRVRGAGNTGAARSTNLNGAAGLLSLRHLLPAHPWAVVAYITNYSTFLLLVLLYTDFSTATSLTRKVPGLLIEPRQLRAAQLLPAAPSRGNQLPISRHKLYCRLEAEQGKEFWRRLCSGVRLAALDETYLEQGEQMQTYTLGETLADSTRTT